MNFAAKFIVARLFIIARLEIIYLFIFILTIYLGHLIL